MADTYTIYVLGPNGEMIETTGGTGNPTTPNGPVLWDDIIGKPATYPSSAHTTEIGEVNGLTQQLNALATTPMTLVNAPAGYSHTVNEISSVYTRGTTRTDIVVRFRGFTDPKATADLWVVGDEWLRPE
jgi:hypothetical protein